MAKNIFHFHDYDQVNLYIYDYVDSMCKVVPFGTLGFEKGPIKVKILENFGLDIAKADKDFITDIQLDSKLRKFFSSIDLDKYSRLPDVKKNCWQTTPQQHVDYEEEKYWALTSKLRGYQVKFLYACEIPKDRKPKLRLIPKTIATLLKVFLNYGDDFEDSEDFGDDESVVSSNQSSVFDENLVKSQDESNDTISGSQDDNISQNEYECVTTNEDKIDVIPNNPLYPIQNKSHTVNSDSSILSEHSCKSSVSSEEGAYNIDEFRSYYDSEMAIKKAYEKSEKDFSEGLIKFLRDQRQGGNILVIEYDGGQETICRYERERVFQSLVIHFYDKNNFKCCTVFTANSCQASAWDIDLHSDEGAYESGINIYSKNSELNGVVLMGEQNSNDSFNYGMSLYENIIVPDLLVE